MKCIGGKKKGEKRVTGGQGKVVNSTIPVFVVKH